MTERAHARTGDPITSHIAAATIRDLTPRQTAVWWVLDNLTDGGTEEQIADAYHTAIRGGMNLPAQEPSSLRTRRHELVEKGFVANTGRKERKRNGGLAIVWATVRA